MIPSKAEVNLHVSRVLREARGDAADPAAHVPPPVRASWLRSLGLYNLDPARTGRPRILEHRAICERRERLEQLLQLARRDMGDLHGRLQASGYCVLMTDADGATIDFRGVRSLDRELQSFGMRSGTCWSEQDEGTGAIGIALAERMPIMVHKEQHFRAHNIGMSCNAAPIFAPDSSILAILNATSFSGSNSHDSHLVYHMVVRSAAAIENALFADHFKHAWIVSLADADGGEFEERLVAFEESGAVIGANAAARRYLGGVDVDAQQDIGALFDQSSHDLIRFAHRHPGWNASLRCHANGLVLKGRLRAPARKEQRVYLPPESPVTLGDLTVRDERLVRVAQQLKRIADHRIPILLLGETGCGKEVFARAIHRQSRRRSKPFVALNCAALPEGLIESELFGYHGGAFTGARAQGEKGKIQQAAGGTLFLDEIGDMPLALQTRLLRVLSEGELLPLGASQPTRVDLHVVCATHRDLEARVDEGAFRQDLFFRLNAATFHLPALRERTDRRELIQQIFDEECVRQDRPGTLLAAETLDGLCAYAWPGNVRELRNVLGYALALCDEGCMLTPELLPAGIGESAATRGGGNAPRPRGGRSLSSVRAKQRATQEDDRNRIVDALKTTRWHMAHAATLLGVSRTTLFRKIRRYGILAARRD